MDQFDLLSGMGSQTPLMDSARAELDRQTQAGTHLAAGGTVVNGEAVAQAAVVVEAKGWRFGAVGSWAKRSGYAAAAMIGWVPGGGKDRT